MILLIGKTPPPYGGVTMYVNGIVENKKVLPLPLKLLIPSVRNVLLSVFYLRKITVIHVIVSKPILRLYYAILALFFSKKIIITYTGNLGRFGEFQNKLNSWSLKLATLPLLLNEYSYQLALSMNSKAQKVSTFIPPKETKDQSENVLKELGLTGQQSFFITNASHMAYDIHNNEIYGILNLIKIFSRHLELILVIADPSGAYATYLKDNNISLSSNIKLVSKTNFSFIDLVKVSHCLIRSTTTDGDSLSVYEGLYLEKYVLCSDVVSRPKGALLYRNLDFKDLEDKLMKIALHKIERPKTVLNDGLDEIKKVYINLSQ